MGYASGSAFIENITRLIISVFGTRSDPEFALYENGSMIQHLFTTFNDREFTVSPDKNYRVYISNRQAGHEANAVITQYF